MPFSFFAARCMYVAKQPLQYRRDVIRRLYTTRVVAHATLFTSVKTTDILASLSLLG